MATRKTTAEQIADAESKIRQYENRMKMLLQKQKTQERKERTHRLIERGAILESLIDKADTLTNGQIKALLIVALKPSNVPQGGGSGTAQTTGNDTGKTG